MTLNTLLKQTSSILLLSLITSCLQSNPVQTATNQKSTAVETKQNPTDFLPKGYTLFETIKGDLNNDQLEDCVYIIKATDKSRIIKDNKGNPLDQNRRGIIVVFNKNGHYELATKNYDCFASENEDGGVYFAPDLSVDIKNNTLLIHYGHGRYGYWQYRFRYHNSDFELISYLSSDGAPVIRSETSIDFVSKIKQEKVNTNPNAVGGDEVFTTTSKTIAINKLIQLSEIKGFDELDMSVF